MTIFEALRQSHDVQRQLCASLLETVGDSPERQSIFQELKAVLTSHAAAEERYFYRPLMDQDGGMQISRHAIAEHHEVDELIEQLDETEMSSPGWLAAAKKLSEKVHHHLLEEEHGFFQQAGKLLTDTEKNRLAKEYLADYERLLAEPA